VKNPRFEYAKRSNGTSEFQEFLDSLTPAESNKILMLIQAIEEHGLMTAEKLKWVSKLEDNLFEIRTQRNKHWLRGLYFKVVGNQYVITHGFEKKTNKTPEREKRHAREIRRRWYERKKD